MTRQRWIGRWIIGVAVIHTVFACIVFQEPLADILKRGVWNSIGDDPMRGAVAWFLLCGGFILLCGLAIDTYERSDSAGSLKAVGWGLLIVTVFGIVLMPVSGLWLLIPPIVGSIRQTGKN